MRGGPHNQSTSCCYGLEVLVMTDFTTKILKNSDKILKQ